MRAGDSLIPGLRWLSAGTPVAQITEGPKRGPHRDRRTAGHRRRSRAGGMSSSTCHSGAAHGYIADKARYLARLKRIEGQARGIHRMVDEDVYCIDILTQISALTSALEGVALALLDDHLRHCVVSAAARVARSRGEAARGIRGDRPARQILTRIPPGPMRGKRTVD